MQHRASNSPTRLQRDRRSSRVFFAMEAHSNPVGATSNCYKHALKPPLSQYRARTPKLQPGYACAEPSAKLPLAFHDLPRAARQLRQRVKCDQGAKVRLLPPPYSRKTLEMELPRGYHMFAGIVGPHDFHFTRRDRIRHVLADNVFRYRLREENRRELKEALAAGGKYVWTHNQGHSGGVHVRDARGRAMFSPVPREHVGMRAQPAVEPGTPTSDFDFGHLHYPRLVGLWVMRSRSARTASAGEAPVNTEAMARQLIRNGVPAPILAGRKRLRARARALGGIDYMTVDAIAAPKVVSRSTRPRGGDRTRRRSPRKF